MLVDEIVSGPHYSIGFRDTDLLGNTQNEVFHEFFVYVGPKNGVLRSSLLKSQRSTMVGFVRFGKRPWEKKNSRLLPIQWNVRDPVAREIWKHVRAMSKMKFLATGCPYAPRGRGL